jgi:glycosyltransferase involved in cell wall biosynthesis
MDWLVYLSHHFNLKNPMQTIIIATSMPFGTIPLYFHHMGRAFTLIGYRVIIVLDDFPSKMPQNESHLIFEKWPSHRPTKWKDYKFFMKLLKRERPVMCLSNFGATNMVTFCSYWSGVPARWNYIHTLSSQIESDTNRTITSRFRDYRKNLVYSKMTGFLTNAKGTKNDAVAKFGIAPQKIDVGSYLIKESELTYKLKHERAPHITLVGRFNKSKGHSKFLEQFEQLLVEFPHIILNLIGTGPLAGELKIQCKKQGIQNNVNFVGYIPNDEIGAYFSNSLLGISSSYHEAFGIVNIESLREGTPILCTKTSGSLDILELAVNGEFFDNLDQGEFLKSFKQIYLNWETYSLGALDTFKKKYSLESLDSRILEYDQRIKEQL